MDGLEKNVTLDPERNPVTPALLMEESVPTLESGSSIMPPEDEEENKNGPLPSSPASGRRGKKLLDIPEVSPSQARKSACRVPTL